MPKPRRLLVASGLAALTLAAVSAALAGDNTSGFTTSQDPMLTPVMAGVTVAPIMTVGDTLKNGYRFEAIPDGIAVRARGQGRVDVYVNHETSKTPFPYNRANPTAANSENDFDNSQVSHLILNQHSGGVLNGSFAIASSLGAGLPPDAAVVLLDAPSLDAVDEAVAVLEEAGPDLSLVVLGPPGASRRLTLAGPSFAWAVLARDAESARIEAAVRAVAAGLVVVEPEFASDIFGHRAVDLPRASGPLGSLPGPDDLEELTGRERQVLTLVATGLANKAIAQRLAISDHTVKFHVASILAKLGAESRTEAVHLAARRGLLTL